MSYVDPPSGGIASDNVSPVTASQVPDGKLLHVGTRSSGLPTGTDQVDSLVTTAYDLLARRFMRKRLVFDPLASVAVSRQSHNGAVVQLNLVNDLDDDPTTATLVEDFDVLPTPVASFKTTVILNEYGRVVTSTKLLRGTSMVPVDPIKAERTGRNAAATIDRLAYNTLLASGGITNTGGAGGAVNDVTVTTKPSDTLRAASQYFKDNNMEPGDDGYYNAVLTPAAETALRKEADAAGWRYWQINQDAGGGSGSIARGYVGDYEGFHIMVTTAVASGVGGVFVANEALVKAFPMADGFGSSPEIVVAPVVDRLKRFASIGWYWLGGYARFRAEAVCTGNPAG